MKKTGTPIIFTFIILTGICLLLNVSAQPGAMPHVVFGEVSNEAGVTLANAQVEIINERTGESLSVVANNNGQYQADLASMPSGYEVGDSIKVSADSGELSGESSVTVSTGPNDQCNLVLKEQSGTPFPGLGAIIIVSIALAGAIALLTRRKPTNQ